MAQTVTPLAILLGTNNDNRLYNRGTTPWTLIGTLGTQYIIPDILSFVNLALIANGYEIPWSYDGTTLKHLVDGSGTGSVPPGAKHHALHQGYYWVWNTAPISTGGTPGNPAAQPPVPPTNNWSGPSALQSSDLNNPNSWPLANQIFIDKDDGDAGEGMGQFTIAEAGISPTTSQILFKANSAYQMTGVFGSTSPQFSIQRIKTDMGCIAPRSIRFAPGFGLIRLSDRGFALFNGVDDRLISEEIRPLIFGSEIYPAVNRAAVEGAYAVVVPNPPMYLCAVPITDQSLTRWFCYDLVRQGWTVLQYPNAVSTMQVMEDPGLMPQVLMGDYGDGAVRQIFSGQTTDDGAVIGWQVIMRPIGGGSPQSNGYFRRAVIKVADVHAGQTITTLAIVGPVGPTFARQVSKTLVVSRSAGLGVGWGEQPYGTSPYGGIASNAEADLTQDIGLIGTNLREILSGQGQIRIRGIEYHVHVKPLRRAAMYG